jgi:signal transduction histidine kinase
VARRVLRRIDAMTGTAQRIMAGDLSGRLPVGRSGDELDRLAGNLNAMLERIEALMMGLKEVSDNIAHDLKTPLTRLRNRAEEALARAGNEAEYRTALEGTIEESDGLIRTFNALLMIARAESGQARDNMDNFDAADVANGIHELYEPLAEDDGMTLRVKTVPAPLHGNRELISQALANLVENAIKYGKPAAAQPLGADAVAGAREILIEAQRDRDQVLLSVSDHGPGIPESDRKHAVERFVRLEASRTQPGSGLGLSLASAVATLHGGDLRLGDAHPGLRATLAIPALAAAAGDRLAAQTPDVPQKVA